MKKILASLSAVLVLMFATANLANAKVEQPLWTCALDFEMEGKGAKLIFGSFKFEGTGMISCMDIAGNVEELPVRVTMGAQPISLSAGFGSMTVKGVATGIGISTSPYALLGDYIVADARASLGVGVGANLSLHGASNSVTLNASVQVVKGYGMSVGVETLTISPLLLE